MSISENTAHSLSGLPLFREGGRRFWEEIPWDSYLKLLNNLRL